MSAVGLFWLALWSAVALTIVLGKFVRKPKTVEDIEGEEAIAMGWHLPVPGYSEFIPISAKFEPDLMTRESEKGEAAMTEAHHSTTEMALLAQQMNNLEKDNERTRNAFEKGLTKLGGDLASVAEAFKSGMKEMQLSLVAKAELEAFKALQSQRDAKQDEDIKFVRQIVLGFCALILGTVGAALLSGLVLPK